MDPDEKLIRRELARIRTYPRWKQSGLGGYLYYIAPDAWVEEAFRQRDGKHTPQTKWPLPLNRCQDASQSFTFFRAFDRRQGSVIPLLSRCSNHKRFCASYRRPNRLKS